MRDYIGGLGVLGLGLGFRILGVWDFDGKGFGGLKCGGFRVCGSGVGVWGIGL